MHFTSQRLKLLTGFVGSVLFVSAAMGVPLALASLTFTGSNITSDGALNITASTSTFSGDVFSQGINNTQYCNQFPGADASVQIQNCIAALPATGGIADARGFQGAQNISVDIFAGSLGGPTTLLLGDAAFICASSPITNSACINIPSNARIIGTGPTQTIIRLPNGWTSAWYRVISNPTNDTDMEVANLQLDGNQGNYGGSDRLTRQAHCVFVQQATRYKLHDLTIHDCLGDGVQIWGGGTTPSEQVTVYNNYIHDIIEAGVGIISAADTEVYGNTIDAGSQPVFSGIHGEPSSLGQWSYKIDIHDNTLLNGEDISDTSPSTNGLKTSQNMVRNNTLIGGGITWYRNPYSEISGNHIISYLGDVALQVLSHDIKVLNNVITAQSPSYVPTINSQAISIDNSSANSGSGEAAGYGNNLIQGNTIDGYDRIGIILSNSSWNRVIDNNVRNIQQVSGNSWATYQQQTASGLSHDNQFQGNTITDTQATSTTNYAIGWDGAGSAPNLALNSITNMVMGPTLGSVNIFTQATGTTNSVQPLSSASDSKFVQYIDSAGVQHLATPATSTGVLTPLATVNTTTAANRSATTIYTTDAFTGAGLYLVCMVEYVYAAGGTGTNAQLWVEAINDSGTGANDQLSTANLTMTGTGNITSACVNLPVGNNRTMQWLTTGAWTGTLGVKLAVYREF
jgi:parallel beta-helix repeat protein